MSNQDGDFDALWGETNGHVADGDTDMVDAGDAVAEEIVTPAPAPVPVAKSVPAPSSNAAAGKKAPPPAAQKTGAPVASTPAKPSAGAGTPASKTTPPPPAAAPAKKPAAVAPSAKKPAPPPAAAAPMDTSDEQDAIVEDAPVVPTPAVQKSGKPPAAAPAKAPAKGQTTAKGNSSAATETAAAAVPGPTGKPTANGTTGKPTGAPASTTAASKSKPAPAKTVAPPPRPVAAPPAPVPDDAMDETIDETGVGGDAVVDAAADDALPVEAAGAGDEEAAAGAGADEAAAGAGTKKPKGVKRKSEKISKQALSTIGQVRAQKGTKLCLYTDNPKKQKHIYTIASDMPVPVTNLADQLWTVNKTTLKKVIMPDNIGLLEDVRGKDYAQLSFVHDGANNIRFLQEFELRSGNLPAYKSAGSKGWKLPDGTNILEQCNRDAEGKLLVPNDLAVFTALGLDWTKQRVTDDPIPADDDGDEDGGGEGDEEGPPAKIRKTGKGGKGKKKGGDDADEGSRVGKKGAKGKGPSGHTAAAFADAAFLANINYMYAESDAIGLRGKMIKAAADALAHPQAPSLNSDVIARLMNLSRGSA